MKVKKTKKHRSKEEKLQILKEAKEKGVNITLKKYGMYRATYYQWKKRFDQMGEEGLTHSMNQERMKKISELEQEVDLLKQLLAEKELESKLKDEMLKKKYPKVKRKYS